MRTYECFDFRPCEETPDNIFNTFNGIDGDKEEVVKDDYENSLMWFDYKNVVCCGDEKIEEYLTKWIPNIIQHPLKKSNTSMILKGNQGCGKDSFTKFLNLLLGDDYYFNTGNPDLVFGKFNGNIENKCICVLNETSGKYTFEINEHIKEAITRNHAQIFRTRE